MESPEDPSPPSLPAPSALEAVPAAEPVRATPPGFLRRYFPALVLGPLLVILVTNHFGSLDPAWTLALGILVGFMLFPPGRHRFAARYPGVPWGLWTAAFLVSLLFLFQHLVLTLWVVLVDSRALHSTIQLLVLSGIGSAAAAIAALMYLKSRGRTLADLGLTRRALVPGAVHGVRLGLVLVTLNVLFVKFSSSADIWTLAGVEVTAMLYNAEDLTTGLVCLVLATLVAPLAEEILFRGVLFAALRSARGPFWATIWSALLFGVVHGVTAVMVTFFGLGFALAYHLTGTLWTSIVAHAVLNGVTASIAWNHGHLTTHASWGQIAGLLAVLAVVLPVSGWILRRWSGEPEPGPCPTCGEKDTLEGRCTRCATPLQPLGKWTRRLMETAASGYLLVAGLLALTMHGLTRMGYNESVPSPVLLVQAGLQSGAGTDRGFQLAKDWVADRPDDPMGRVALSGFLYQRGDFHAMIEVLEPGLRKAGSIDPAFQLQNVLSLALAEMGRGEAATDLARAAVDGAPPEYRPAIEDTLGWALANSGRLAEASSHIEQAVSSMDFLRRADVAELSYHRGLVHLAGGEDGRGRELLGEAARTGEAGHWFSRRAREILAAGKDSQNPLPVDLSAEVSRVRLAMTSLTAGTADVRSVTDPAVLRLTLDGRPEHAPARLRLLGVLLGLSGLPADGSFPIVPPAPSRHPEILQHLVWFIQNASEDPALPAIPPRALPVTGEFQDALLAAWKARVDGKPSSYDPLRAAARMTALRDPHFAVACLERAYGLRPNAVAREELARARLRVISITPVPARADLARRTLEWLEASDPDRGKPRPATQAAPVWSLGKTELSRRAVVALEAHDDAKAAVYADALLDHSTLFLQGQNGPRGIGNHLGNIVLGHLCLRRGDRDNARRHLQVSSFIATPSVSDWQGPDLTLARRLARRGQPAAASEYLTTWMDLRPRPQGLPTLAGLVRSNEDEARSLLRWVLEDMAMPGHPSLSGGGPR